MRVRWCHVGVWVSVCSLTETPTISVIAMPLPLPPHLLIQEELGLPVVFTRGFIQELKVYLPLANLLKESIKITLNNVEVGEIKTPFLPPLPLQRHGVTPSCPPGGRTDPEVVGAGGPG